MDRKYKVKPREELKKSGKPKVACASAIPDQPAAEFIIQLIEICGDEDQGCLQSLDRIVTARHLSALTANTYDLEWALVVGRAV